MDEPESISCLITRLRHAAGLSQSAEAGALCAVSGKGTVTRHEVSRWERGERVPTTWLPHLAKVLDVPLGVLRAAAEQSRMPSRAPTEKNCTVNGFLVTDEWSRADSEALAAIVTQRPDAVTAAAALRIAHEWLVSDPPQIYEMHAGRRIGEDLIAKAEARIEFLRRLDDLVGGADLYNAVRGELRADITLLKEAACSERLFRRLLRAIADLLEVAGWITSDAGRHAEAEHYYLAGVKAAHAAGDAPLAANLLSTLSYQVANVGDRRKAVTLARTAAVGVKTAGTPLVRALAYERVAWAHARAGDRQQADRALGIVEYHFANASPGDQPAWTYWLNRTEINVMAGRVNVELGRPLRAEPLLAGALEGYPAEHTRERALYTSWLAEAYIQAREIEQAAEIAWQALDFATAVNSPRAADRIAAVAQALGPYRKVAAVAQFEDYWLARRADHSWSAVISPG